MFADQFAGNASSDVFCKAVWSNERSFDISDRSVCCLRTKKRSGSKNSKRSIGCPRAFLKIIIHAHVSILIYDFFF